MKRSAAGKTEAVVREVLAADPAVLVGYLFGSVVRNEAGPLSDVDVGVLFSNASSAEGDKGGDLMDRLVLRLGTEKVDLIDLARAPMPLRYRVVREGRLVLCRDAIARERFESDTVRRYLDFKPIRDRALAAVGRTIRGTDD